MDELKFIEYRSFYETGCLPAHGGYPTGKKLSLLP